LKGKAPTLKTDKEAESFVSKAALSEYDRKNRFSRKAAKAGWPNAPAFPPLPGGIVAGLPTAFGARHKVQPAATPPAAGANRRRRDPEL
jgi:hypothetical protein